MGEIEKQLNNYRLTTAEILYHLPDHPALLLPYHYPLSQIVFAVKPHRAKDGSSYP